MKVFFFTIYKSLDYIRKFLELVNIFRKDARHKMKTITRILSLYLWQGHWEQNQEELSFRVDLIVQNKPL